MTAPIIAIAFGVLAAVCLGLSALFGVSTLADWTIDAAQVFLVLAIVVFYGYFLTGCVSEFRNT